MSNYSTKHILLKQRQDEHAEHMMDLLMQEIEKQIVAHIDADMDAYRDAMRDMGNVVVLHGDLLDTDEFWNSGSGAPE